MTDFSRIQQAFARARDLRDQARAEFLDGLAAEDPELRREVVSLLAHDPRSSEFDLANADLDLPVTPATPLDRIGPYRILETLGEGGFGVVYRAEQSTPVSRQVAVKVLHAGPQSRAVLARFQHERDALARLDHPGIARVFDAGTDDLGRPFIAMELVHGRPFIDACSALDLPRALDAFVDLCLAVHHAHQRGLIHRDLKPANILAFPDADRLRSKVIDFGVAKAIAHTDGPTLTRIGQPLGTPAYMSPEQAAGSRDIDIRTDVYSLGVILYEILAGDLPFDRALLESSSLDAVLRHIREAIPPTPSARSRRSAGTTTARRFPPDLDWVAMRAIEKDRERRYASAADLATDVQLAVRFEPVTARPPSASYRARRFIRRHRAASAVALVSTLSGGALLALGVAALRARADAATARANESKQAAEAERLVAGAARREADAARQSADDRQEMLDFYVSALSALDPTAAANPATARDITLLSALRGSLVRLTAESASSRSPTVRAALLQSLGTVFLNLGQFTDALSTFHLAASLYESALGPAHEDTLASRLGAARALAGKGSAAAEREYRAIIKTCEADGPRGRTLYEAKASLAESLTLKGRFKDAETLARDALSNLERLVGPVDPATLATLDILASTLGNWGLRIRSDAKGPDGQIDDPVLAARADSLIAESERLFQLALDRRVERFGPSHPDTLTARHNMAGNLWRRGEHERAARLMLECLAQSREVWGEKHPTTIRMLHNAAVFAVSIPGTGWEDSRRLAQQASDLSAEINGEMHAETAIARGTLGQALVALNRFDEAEPALLRAYEGMAATLGKDHSYTVRVARDLSILFRRTNRADLADHWRDVADAAQREH